MSFPENIFSFFGTCFSFSLPFYLFYPFYPFHPSTSSHLLRLSLPFFTLLYTFLPRNLLTFDLITFLHLTFLVASRGFLSWASLDWGIEMREHRDSHSCPVWRLNKWHRYLQLPRLSQQLLDQQQMFQQSLEMQRQQSQVRTESLTSVGAAQVAKDEKAWPDWRCKFRVEATRCFRQAAAILDWAEDRRDQPISESEIQHVAAKENRVDMANFNMQLHGDLVSPMEGAPKVLILCVTPRLKWVWMPGEG